MINQYLYLRAGNQIGKTRNRLWATLITELSILDCSMNMACRAINSLYGYVARSGVRKAITRSKENGHINNRMADYKWMDIYK